MRKPITPHYLFSLDRLQFGFSLLEVLVALLIISIGLLTVVGMQALSISNTDVSGFRAVAASQASSMAAAMSANKAYWQTALAKASVPYSVTVNASTPIASPDCSNTNCTSTQMATYDLYKWSAALTQALPNGIGTVSCNVSKPTYNGYSIKTVTCQIVVSWNEKSLQEQQVSSIAITASSPYHYEMVVHP